MGSTKAQTPSDVAEFRPGWLGGVDGRTALYFALTARLHQLHTDLGGVENLSVQRQMICERVAFLEMKVRDIETHALKGEVVDYGSYGFLSNVLMGHLKTLGLERKAKPVKSLTEIVQETRRAD